MMDNLSEISRKQDELEGVEGYANHDTAALISVLGTAHGLTALGKLSEDEVQAFLVVADAIIRNAP